MSPSCEDFRCVPVVLDAPGEIVEWAEGCAHQLVADLGCDAVQDVVALAWGGRVAAVGDRGEIGVDAACGPDVPASWDGDVS